MIKDEFEDLLKDKTKQINGNIAWLENSEHSPTFEFRVQVDSDEGYPLFVKGSYNKLINSLRGCLKSFEMSGIMPTA